MALAVALLFLIRGAAVALAGLGVAILVLFHT